MTNVNPIDNSVNYNSQNCTSYELQNLIEFCRKKISPNPAYGETRKNPKRCKLPEVLHSHNIVTMVLLDFERFIDFSESNLVTIPMRAHGAAESKKKCDEKFPIAGSAQ